MPDKPDLARGWMFVEKLLREEEIESIDHTSDEEVDRQLRAAGIDPEDVPTADELLARAAARARRRGQEWDEGAKIVVPPARPRRGAWVVWLVSVVIGAAVIGAVVYASWYSVTPR